MKNLRKIKKDFSRLSKGDHSLAEVIKMAGYKSHAEKCPRCYTPLSKTQNTYNGFVFQEVIACDNCGYVKTFNNLDLNAEQKLQKTDRHYKLSHKVAKLLFNKFKFSFLEGKWGYFYETNTILDVVQEIVKLLENEKI